MSDDEISGFDEEEVSEVPSEWLTTLADMLGLPQSAISFPIGRSCGKL